MEGTNCGVLCVAFLRKVHWRETLEGSSVVGPIKWSLEGKEKPPEVPTGEPVRSSKDEVP